MSNRHLNTSQTEAVNYNDGPLLIIAGAGTGKTTVITQKIVKLIESGMTRPEEILALTFTDNSAAEMQERVDEAINVSYTDIQISTFHKFCERILQNNGLDIGIGNEFKLFTDTDSWLLIKQHIYDFELDYYRPLANPSRHIHELLKHFSKCKDELISPENYLEYAKNLVLDKDSEQSSIMKVESPDRVNDENDSEERTIEIKRLNEIAKTYHKYNQLLLDNGAMDFGDLIYYSVKLFNERPNILKKYQDHYKYILVDEFQDVNWAQYYLVRLLAQKAKLTVVGDDDQSIYAFRGASVSNIMRFEKDFKDAKKIVLNDNYRSGQEILDNAYKLIQNNNPDRLEVKLKVDKNLKSNSIHKSNVEYFLADNIDNEVKFVVGKICDIHDRESANWDDFAILVRANSQAEPFINYLEKIGIPYEFLSSSGLYRQPIVLDCFNYFKVIIDFHESSAIYRLLKLPFLEFKENDLQIITHNAKKNSISYYEALKKPAIYKLSNDGVLKCEKIINLIHDGMKNSRSDKPTTIMFQFLEKSGYMHYLVQEEEKGNRKARQSIFHLKQFFDFISRYEESLPGADVRSFVDFFTTILASGDEGKLYQPTDTPDSINIMTVHGSKGLEFKHVFVVNLVEERFPSRRKGEAIEIPLPLIKENLPEGDSHFMEERRLFYVAMTRAKESLFLTASDDYGGVRKKKISRFLAELGYNSERVSDAIKEKFSNVSAPELSIANKERDSFAYNIPNVFSYSQIKSYETCPYQYKLAHILKIRTTGNASYSFGQSLHNTLLNFYRRIQELNSVQQSSLFDKTDSSKINGKLTVPSFEELIGYYDAKWIGEWYSSENQKNEFYKKGKEILKIFYTSNENCWTIPHCLESWFKIKIGDNFLHGRIDRVDPANAGELEIIDYKTGESKEKLSNEDKEQLIIYQIAAESLSEYRNLGKVSKLTFYFLKDNIKTSFIGESVDKSKLIDKISNTIDGIKKQNFAPTPSDFVCKHCDFRDICDYRY